MADITRGNESTWDLVIQAGRGERNYWRDVWKQRELLGFLAWRDILLRYKQTFFGVAWAVMQPLLTMVVFSVVFGRFAKLPSDGYPYPLLVYAAMLPWTFLSESLADASNSLVGNSSLISKVYFPRIIMPLSRTIVALVDFAVGLAVYVALMAFYRVALTPRFLAVPLFLALAALTASGLGFLISALNVKYRDFRYVVPFLLRAGLFISPVGFSSAVVPQQWRFLYSLNPAVGVIDGFRWALLGTASLYIPGLVCSIAVCTLANVAGISYFRRTERQFADVI